ncbi:hypothetical protein [Halosolutus gelatinilyticus]|uniref:hypothetical protein n=1 Tax=Halosolutus gelatinilyticus TaxID=2931975 RepID=UPI001FF19317|nr:hypothetical protein [Halosolutus gelatinilyticus]
MMFEPLIIIAVSIVTGYYLSTQYAGHATTLQCLFHLLVATMWLLAAIVTIYTGFYFAGAVLLILFSFFWLSNYRTIRDSDLRRKTSSWNPFGYEQK